MVTGFALPHDKTLFTPFNNHNQRDLSSYSLLSHHAFQPHQLGGIPEGHPLKSDPGPVSGGTLWDMENMVQQVGSFPGSLGHQPGSSHTGGEKWC